MRIFKIKSSYFATPSEAEDETLVRVKGRNRADDEVLAERDRLIPITKNDVAHVTDLARYCFWEFAPKHLGKQVDPHYVCYGNNAASLAQAAHILRDGQARPDITVIPSAGHSKRLAGGHEPTDSTLAQTNSTEAYRQLFRDAKISPDDIVHADPKHPVVFMRPLAVTATSYKGLEEFLNGWVDELAKEHFPNNFFKQNDYKERFYQNSYIVGIKPKTMHGEKTEPFKSTRWDASAHQLQIAPPEQVSRSAWKMRNVNWVNPFRLDYEHEEPHNAIPYDEKTHGVILKAMQEYAQDKAARPESPLHMHAQQVSLGGTMEQQYFKALAGDNPQYAAHLEAMGYSPA